jgi:ABC-2 type transport system ATP-binding protein
VTVRTPDADRFAQLASSPEVTITTTEPSLLIINGLTAAQIGEFAAREGIVLHELTPTTGTLEDAYMQLTADDVEYRSATQTEATR